MEAGTLLLSERDKETVNTDKLDGNAHKTGYFLHFDLETVETHEIREKSDKSTVNRKYKLEKLTYKFGRHGIN